MFSFGLVLKIVTINPINNKKSYINHKICPEIKTIGDYFSFVDNWHQQWKIIKKKKKWWKLSK